jgi:5-methylcytosine-specific restriction endonuclease McrA
VPRPRAATVCSTTGCPNLQPCERHARQPWEGSTRASRLPRDWRQRRARVLSRDRHTCQACAGSRCGNERLEVDHIARGDDHSDSNLQTLGHACHAAKTAQEAADARWIR